MSAKLQPFIKLLAGITGPKVYQLFAFMNDHGHEATSVASVKRYVMHYAEQYTI